MSTVKENRRRSVQVKFRLTPFENAVFERDVINSGLSKNDYLIKTLINRVGLSAISCERKYFPSGVDISLTMGNQRIGYVSCLFFKNLKIVQLSSFYVVKPFQDIGVEEKLLAEIWEFADLNDAAQIVAYPGAEPYCPTEWKSLEMQIKWYQDQGFIVDHKVNGTTPCMVKKL